MIAVLVVFAIALMGYTAVLAHEQGRKAGYEQGRRDERMVRRLGRELP